MEPIILIGGGGHCISCIDVIRSENKFKIIGIFDTPDKIGNLVLGIPIIGTDSDIPNIISKCKNFIVTVGQIKSPFIRCKIFDLIKKNGGNLPIIISERAYVSSSAFVDEGSIIMHNVLINANAKIGKNCIINTGALIEHESIIEDFCHISTHAVVNGQVKVGKNSFLGSNCVIANNVSLPEDIIVAAGTCILKSPLETGTFIGNPARKISRR
jgi:sugar O-acyltransferase (sialic acid O-acetyltransferase NeuD family)